MPNKYGSAIRTYIARNLAELPINPPSLLTVTNAQWISQFFELGRDISNLPINPDSNFHIHRVGLFSNFADGLVPCASIGGPRRLNLRVHPQIQQGVSGGMTHAQ